MILGYTSIHSDDVNIRIIIVSHDFSLLMEQDLNLQYNKGGVRSQPILNRCKNAVGYI